MEQTSIGNIFQYSNCYSQNFIPNDRREVSGDLLFHPSTDWQYHQNNIKKKNPNSTKNWDL